MTAAPATATTAATRPTAPTRTGTALLPLSVGFARLSDPEAAAGGELGPTLTAEPADSPAPGLAVGVARGAVKSLVAVAAAAAPVIWPGPWGPVAVKYKLTAV